MDKLKSFFDGFFSVYGLSKHKHYKPLDDSEIFRKPNISDKEALESDWKNIGLDLRNAMNRYGSQESEPKTNFYENAGKFFK